MSSTESAAGRDAGMRPWHFFLLLAMVGATWAVIEARDTHPAALLLLSGAVIAAGLVAVASHQALSGFFGGDDAAAPLAEGERRVLEEEKALVLRSIKELEFDHQMRKISDADFAEIGGRLRAKAMVLIEQLDHAPAEPEAELRLATDTGGLLACGACGTTNPRSARFCNQCGAKL